MSHSSKNGGIKKPSEADFRFEPPPEAPVFCPTEEEWEDPLGFIRSIRKTAEAWGICKIRPPAAWQPPFALDVDRFAFTPRIQRLNELEAKTRVKLNFLDSIAKFWELQGSTLKIPVLERRALDLCALHRLVAAEGGHEEVTTGRRWSKLAIQLGFAHGAGALLRGHYMRILYPYDVFQRNKPVPLKSDTGDEEVEEKPTTSVGMRRRRRDSDSADAKPDVENNELRRLQFFGPGPKMAGFVASPPDPFDPLSKYACLTCGSGGAEESMLLCDGCDDSYHTFCLKPPLSAIPAGDWRCPRCVALEVSKPQEAFGFEQARREYTLQQFGEMADEFKCSYFNMPVHRVSTSAVEAEFWRVVSSIDEDVTVEYGADLHTMDHGSGFPTRSIAGMHPIDQAYADSPWNLNNLPTLPGSVLAHINADISGMKVPWMYVGMCFAAFCWHNEDHWSYSINYLHWGEPKTWYGVSGHNAEAFEKTMRAAAPELFQSQPDLLHQLVTIMNPNILTAAGVSVCRTDQNCGEFVVTFPRAYHAGFNQGYNFAEAVNFAPADWLPMGRECVEHYSNLRRFCVFAHDELVVRMAINHAELDLNEAASAYQDMNTMVMTEQAQRKALLKWGVKSSKRQELESLPDDARQCHACKTTCFLSAVTCSCCPGRLVCLRHYDRLCSCPPASHMLRFRHLPDELPPLLSALAAASGAWDSWMHKVRAALKSTGPKRLTLGELEALAQEARRRRFPPGDLLKALEAQISQARKLVGITHKITGTSPVLRLSADELRTLLNQFDNLPCAPLPEATELATLLQETNTAELVTPKEEPMDVEDGDAWLARANTALNSPRVGRREAIVALLSAADLLPAHSEEVADALAALRTALERAEEVEKRVNDALADDTATPIDIKALRTLLREAQQVPTSTACLEKLKSTYRTARLFLREATTAMRGGELLPYYDAVKRLVARGAALPLRLRALPELRKRLAVARRWKLEAAKVFLQESVDPHHLMSAITPKTAFGVASLNRPPPALGPPVVGNLLLGGAGVEAHVVRNAFRKAFAAELNLLRKLTSPVTLSVSTPICTCRMPRGRGQVIRCLVCCDSFHHGCLEPEMIKKPVFVCVGCCRTMRPTLKSVLGLLVGLRPLMIRLPEGEALQSLADRALVWQDRARNMLASPPVLRGLQEMLAEHTQKHPKLSMLTANSMREAGTIELIAGTLDSAASPQSSSLKGGTLSSARELLREGSLLELTLDECRVLARLSRPPDVAKRPRSPRSPARAAKGRRRTSNVVYTAASSDSEEMSVSEPLATETASTGDEEFCAAEDCAGRHVHWVQCDNRCKRWFHLACVGMADVVIKEADVFYCPACRLGDPLEIIDGEIEEDVDSPPCSPPSAAEM